MTETPKPDANLFAPGSKEQRAVDQFLARFSPETAAHLVSELRTGRTRIESPDRKMQAELDVIYAALDAKNQASGRPDPSLYASKHIPGPAEAALIEQYLTRFSPDVAARLRESFSRADVEVGSDNPENAQLLKSIYRERQKAREFER